MVVLNSLGKACGQFHLSDKKKKGDRVTGRLRSGEAALAGPAQQLQDWVVPVVPSASFARRFAWVASAPLRPATRASSLVNSCAVPAR